MQTPFLQRTLLGDEQQTLFTPLTPFNPHLSNIFHTAIVNLWSLLVEEDIVRLKIYREVGLDEQLQRSVS